MDFQRRGPIFFSSRIRWEVNFRFVDIDVIIDNHCLKLYFLQYKLECIATIQVVHSTNWTASCLYHVVHSKNRTVSRQYKDTQNDKLNSIFAGAHIHIEYVYAENQH
jgi:hypothetical protein